MEKALLILTGIVFLGILVLAIAGLFYGRDLFGGTTTEKAILAVLLLFLISKIRKM